MKENPLIVNFSLIISVTVFLSSLVNIAFCPSEPDLTLYHICFTTSFLALAAFRPSVTQHMSNITVYSFIHLLSSIDHSFLLFSSSLSVITALQCVIRIRQIKTTSFVITYRRYGHTELISLSNSFFLICSLWSKVANTIRLRSKIWSLLNNDSRFF